LSNPVASLIRGEGNVHGPTVVEVFVGDAVGTIPILLCFCLMWEVSQVSPVLKAISELVLLISRFGC